MAKRRYWEENRVSGTELMAMRMMRGKTVQDMARGIRKYPEPMIFNYDARTIERYEKNLAECPVDLVEYYMVTLGITRSHMAQFKKILKGKLKTFEEDREIPTFIKDQVRKKCKRKCVVCGDKKKLHFHHKEHFAKGGQNTVENLILLCASCHAEAHKGETSYHLLKSMAEKE